MARLTPAEPDERPEARELHAPVSSLDPPRNTVRRRALRYARRLLSGAAFAGALFVAFSYVVEPVLERRAAEQEAAAPASEGESAEAEAAPEPPPRPDAVPARIPPWAWELNEWHSTSRADRGPRPEAAPRQVPAWYWEWRQWRQDFAAAAGT